MRRIFARIFAFALVILPASLSHAWANDRVALVIGNSRYARVAPLQNPTNDAADMKVALEKLGFEVIVGFDLTKPEMDRKIAEFSVKLWGSKIGLFFYAGHGIQLDNANYLVPVDAEANSLAALEFSLIRAQSIQELMQRYTETSILFLDSCRDFPPVRALSRGNSGSGRGLARVDAKVDTLISFSTEPGSIAKDGTGRNSPFTEALTALIGTPQKDLSSILIDVRNRVLQATNNEQITWEHSALRRHVYLADAASISTAAIPERQEAAPAGNAQIAMLTPPASQGMGVVRSVNTGAQKLIDSRFELLKGKRIGLITNQSAMVGGEHIVDILYRADNVKLASILVPEHGFLGRIEAGARVQSTEDHVTGLPVHSLYGETRKPTAAMLKDLDVLVFDVQEVGARFYTYISTLGLAMQAAADAGIPLVILDRPNPLGGDYVSGFVTEEPYKSFIGQYRIPIAHGMTVGELAGMIKNERMLPGLEKLNLSVVRMEGWRRAMRWPAFNDLWIPTSPALRQIDSVLLYPGTALLEGTSISVGRGTELSFRQIGAPGLDGERLAQDLTARKLPGVRFAPVRFTPRRMPGVSEKPLYEGQMVSGVRIDITDRNAIEPVEVGIELLAAVSERIRRDKRPELIRDAKHFEKLVGTGRLKSALASGATAPSIVSSWADEVARFKSKRAAYLLYE